MEPIEIANQLIELAQTPEQIQYLTSNNTTILADRIEQMKQEYFANQKQQELLAKYNKGRDDAYLSVFSKLFSDRYHG
jgi:hypothetical protein